MWLRTGSSWLRAWTTVIPALCLLAAAGGVLGYRHVAGTDRATANPPASDYVDIGKVPIAAAPPRPQAGASTGSWRSVCGRNRVDQHHNTDNMIVAPGVPGGAHHMHDYVGNLSTNARSTDKSLAAARTTCAHDDRSVYGWPVLRLPNEH